MTEAVVAGFEEWRALAREFLRRSVPPEEVYFSESLGGQALLPLGDEQRSGAVAKGATVPREFLELAKVVALHRDGERWSLLYQVLWRITHGEAHLLADHADVVVRTLRTMEKAVRRDIHKMRAFVRFRRTAEDVYVAWYKPDHHIVRANAAFFVRRFGAMRWCILTPDESAYWDLKELKFGPGTGREAAPREDEIESLWLAYYGSIFNPARLNIPAMTAEMPVRHWQTLPETQLISELLHQADERVIAMVKKQPPSARPFVPAEGSLPKLAVAARGCQGCDLYLNATQTVFGEGPERARIMLVGEQPGDQEDVAGRPFVGPAGKLLDKALEEAGIDRSIIYVTNAVKHFRFEERGKRRIHKKPGGVHISACRPWLEAEIARIRPETIVCLGATAAQSLAGRAVRIQADRGKWLDSPFSSSRLMITIHPSALLRLPESMSYEEEYARFVEDLRLVKQ